MTVHRRSWKFHGVQLFYFLEIFNNPIKMYERTEKVSPIAEEIFPNFCSTNISEKTHLYGSSRQKLSKRTRFVRQNCA